MFIIVLLFGACNTIDLFEQSKAFPTHQWQSSDTATFSFEIIDTTALYNVLLVLRHEDAYRYKNIWLTIKMQTPDSAIHIKREFILANNQQWLGNNISDIVEHRITFNSAPAKFKKGKYIFILKHEMREDPLDYILNAGIRVEKVKP